ncbi:SRPBCC family protein [Streptomyces phaeochromogenes]|uniref:SRPBCC family protein n=1 Tax=Streptomyces phaeochromogenes TaxID=1923 RepID=UPI00386A2140|nr:SRPBCC family protein [Streptomyces phaeochromogenes]
MALFVVRRDSVVGVGEAWRRLTVWERHADVVPLTRITVVEGGGGGVGTVFVARSGVGALAFDDPMEVAVWRPPLEGRAGICRLVKRGSFVTGWAEIEVRPGVGGGSRVVWREELRVRWVPRIFDSLVGWVARWVFGQAVRRLLARP